jgi:hypothetical protein
MGPPARRRTDRDRAPVTDRIRWRIVRAGPLLRLLWGTVVIALAVWAIVDVERTETASGERDAARAYQRCEQIVPTTSVVSLVLDRVPRLTAQIQREQPGLLTRGSDGRLHLDVPDCRRIYPKGAAVSSRYPDLTPTKPAP